MPLLTLNVQARNHDAFQSNRILKRVQVVPVTSRTDKVYPGESLFSLVGNRIGKLAHRDAIALNKSLKLQLDLV